MRENLSSFFLTQILIKMENTSIQQTTIVAIPATNQVGCKYNNFKASHNQTKA